MNAKDGVPLLGRPRGGVGGRSSLIDCSTAQILLHTAASHNHLHTCTFQLNDELGAAASVMTIHKGDSMSRLQSAQFEKASNGSLQLYV